MVAFTIIYILNILVAGSIAISAIFTPQKAKTSVFQDAYPTSELIRLVGALWLGIAVISVLGLWKPIIFSPILLLQLIYKGTWLLVVALPAYQQKKPFPKGMATFFIIWVVVLPFIIPWNIWFS
jgi:hypothetical protein